MTSTYETRLFEHDLYAEANPNEARLIELARWLTVEERKRRLGKPSEWDQGKWVDADYGSNVHVQGEVVFWTCGTAACAAGHVALEDGGRPAFHRSGDEGYRPTPPDPADLASSVSDGVMFFDGRPEWIEYHAQATLGLDTDQAAQLFSGDNDWEDMMTQIGDILGLSYDTVVTMAGGDDLPDDDEYDGYAE